MALNYLFEPRSKIDDYDDSGSGGGDPSCIETILLLPLAIPVLLLIEFIPLLAMVVYFIHDVYSTLKRTVNSGNLAYPFLTRLGIFVGLVLALNWAYPVFTQPTSKSTHLNTYLVIAIGFVIIFTILPILAVCVHRLIKFHTLLFTKYGWIKSYGLYLAALGICLTAVYMLQNTSPSGILIATPSTNTPNLTQSLTASIRTPVPTSTSIPIPARSISILVDDFKPQPYQGDAIYFYNRLEGDRGALNNSNIDWGVGQVTATITTGNTWGGIWMSINHPIREGLPINFSAILPTQILPAYQSKITGITVHIAGGTPNLTFRVELKDGNQLQWKYEIKLPGGQHTLNVDLPRLQNISQLVLVLDHGKPGDYIVIDSISLTASTPVLDTATAAFVWSYGMLLNNWNPSSGLARDKAKDASGELDAIQATGSLAAATAIAEQLGILSRVDAIQIVSKISDTLLFKLPTNHGLWPHWVKISSEGKFDIVPNTEWSSVDTVIAAIGLLDAQSALGLDTSGMERMLQAIDWKNLVANKGISHGYTYSNELIPYAWDTFGGESWLADLAYAAATGEVPPLAYPSGMTANGSGFIDELAWLYVLPPSGKDIWGRDWAAYRIEAAGIQTSYYTTNDPKSCLARSGLFGLSAAEVPSPAIVSKDSIYQAFGLGGQFTPLNDGSALLGSPVIVPHYSAMIASLRPEESIRMWDWLITQGLFSPLNNVESLSFPANSNCSADSLEWNQLKGSWNLSLQTLGWGRYLVERNGQVPVLWQVTKNNPFLRKGYLLLAPGEPTPTIDLTKLNGTPTTQWANGPISCDKEPLYRWKLSGIYRYQVKDFYGHDSTYLIEQISRLNNPQSNACAQMPWPNYGELLPSFPTMDLIYIGGRNSCYYDGSIPDGDVSIEIKGPETIATRFGSFQATSVEATQQYNYPNSINEVRGKVTTTEWYVCGFGLMRAKIIHEGHYQVRNFQRVSDLELISFTPLP